MKRLVGEFLPPGSGRKKEEVGQGREKSTQKSVWDIARRSREQLHLKMR